jgi:GT2 family glycosyltransferase
VRAIESQQFPGKIELIIVDDSSTDDTPVVLRRLAAESTISVTALRTPRRSGPAAARNAGWRAATGEVIAFTDDDCVPQPGWLAALVDGIAVHDIVQGRTLAAPDQLYRTGPFSRTIQVTVADGWFQTCNVAYRRTVLESVGGFDERFPDPAGEDTDLAWRALANGAVAGFNEDAVVFHDVSPSRFVARLTDAPRWQAAVLAVKKHPGIRERLPYRYVWRAAHLPALVAAIGLAGTALAPSRGWRIAGAMLVAPYVRFRVKVMPLPGGGRRALAAIPFALVVDVAEVSVLAAASVRYRTVLI